MPYYLHNSMKERKRFSKKPRNFMLKLLQRNLSIWWSDHLNNHKKKNKKQQSKKKGIASNNLQPRRQSHLQRTWQVYLMKLGRKMLKHSFNVLLSGFFAKKLYSRYYGFMDLWLCQNNRVVCYDMKVNSWLTVYEWFKNESGSKMPYFVFLFVSIYFCLFLFHIFY